MTQPRPKISCRLFATDLDGTILYQAQQGGSRVGTRTRQALKRLKEQGTMVVLASGRMHESMARIAGELGLAGSPLLSYNGAMLCLPEKEAPEPAWQEPLVHQPLDAQVAEEIVNLCEERSLALNYYWGGKLYARKFEPWWDAYQGRTTSPMEAVTSLKVMQGKRPHKLLILAEPPQISSLYEELAAKLKGRANVVVTHAEYLEFMHPQANKGRTLARLMQQLGVQAKDVVAAGDGHNDVEMLQTAGTGVAIRGASEHLKKHAHFVAEGPEQDGIAAFIEEHLLV